MSAWGTEPWDSARCWRFGLAERIESIWDGVGRGDRWQCMRERVVSDVIRDSNKSHDEMLHPKRRRCCNLGKWYREKKAETSTIVVDGLPPLCMINDSMLIERGSSPLLTIAEMAQLRRSAVWKPLRRTCRMVSRAARSWSASRSLSSKSRPVPYGPSSSTRSIGAVPQRAYRCIQSCIVLPQKHQSSGVRDATSSQWWQTRRKLYEPLGSPPKSPSGMTFQRKIAPSISGGRVDTFKKEFRVRLSRIMAPSCSLIWLSNARMASRLISRSIAVYETALGVMECLSASPTHIDGDVSSRFAEDWDLIDPIVGDVDERD